jgi:hypothetical protein
VIRLKLRDVRPVDVVHESIDIFRRRAVVHVKRLLYMSSASGVGPARLCV